MRSSFSSKPAVVLGSLLWIGVVLLGFHRALSFEGTAGKSANAPRRWPAQAPLELHGERWTLVLCAHPHCPCTRSSLHELDRLLVRCGGRISTHVLFYADPALGADWEHTDLWEHAGSIPGVEVLADPLGRIAALFGAQVSGQVLLYAPDGALQFDGGITIARGHSGDNPGADAIAALVSGSRPVTRSTPVFGCSLFTEPLAVRSQP